MQKISKDIGDERARRVWIACPIVYLASVMSRHFAEPYKKCFSDNVPTLMKLTLLSVPETRKREHAQNWMLLQGQVGSELSIIYWTYQQGAHRRPRHDNGWVGQKPDSSGLRSEEEKRKQWILP